MLIQVIPAAITDTISADLMPGADKIAGFLGMDRRTVYHLAQTGKIPVFRMGNTICARKSTILRWIADQESRASGGTASMS
ncbi:DNA-binding protein (plasmid) [Azospirillum sp. TSH58]|nr:DNA-binding protein [Azospirillum sp. TSH58]PWC73439.1 hypothetical protein TSH58_04345 [Azospirillum sp. TSH58]